MTKGKIGAPDRIMKYGVSAVDRAITVLNAFQTNRPSLTLKDLVGVTGLNAITILRLLASLER